jgi:hypothetical protein
MQGNQGRDHNPYGFTIWRGGGGGGIDYNVSGGGSREGGLLYFTRRLLEKIENLAYGWLKVDS